ncbi:methylated-DNA-[protein]-cysteine S-methyltransferase [Herbinix hemicellulosilytica]|uniref:Methylated-DNA--protein-cysteine methyltransferase n=1 Tax=Herbinix hemicellulosilytica TaxID=1564487 RepID=A0A0H5SJN6_HERHM|nr:methylated-DNA--[protein]-cysteine S-methyltransferase [Herbinix hemicellulosilytica]RBP58797.1 methylated-DNA-[protein]-cysteine S-methyltransferase [Herbinix hemicellulosilytica]CRZ34996.1 hypothetical protein HHT355_1796 [Herbinix hemicellulosilytica]
MAVGYFYDMPIGRMFICEDGTGINEVTLIKNENEDYYTKNYVIQETELLKKAATQLREYFEGKRKEFNICLNPKGTPFQKKVWDALLKIPYGETRSYKDIAIAVGNPNACRAVGMANHKNPIMCIIPCHRVIGSDGSLTGYGGGIEIKEKLLTLEKIHYGKEENL